MSDRARIDQEAHPKPPVYPAKIDFPSLDIYGFEGWHCRECGRFLLIPAAVNVHGCSWSEPAEPGPPEGSSDGSAEVALSG